MYGWGQLFPKCTHWLQTTRDVDTERSNVQHKFMSCRRGIHLCSYSRYVSKITTATVSRSSLLLIHTQSVFVTCFLLPSYCRTSCFGNNAITIIVATCRQQAMPFELKERWREIASFLCFRFTSCHGKFN